MDTLFRRATQADIDTIEQIILAASRRLGEKGIDQWQRGYPNRESIIKDVENQVGMVLCNDEGEIVAYGAVIFSGEVAYDELTGGEWLQQGQYAVVHRLCVAEEHIGEGYSYKFMLQAEAFAQEKVRSMRIDTHPENEIMQNLIEKLDYTYCGDVVIESRRLAFEKLLV